jgi:hypothetical protein
MACEGLVQFGKPGVSKALNAVREPRAGKARMHGSSGAAFPRGNVATLSLGEHVQKILFVADKTIQVIRGVVTSLRPGALDVGIGAALEWLAAEFSQNVQTACHVCVPEENPELAEDGAVALFRIVQEALTNITRHVHAKQVVIALAQIGDDCLLEVRDDGRGFDQTEIGKKSFGLVGIKESVYSCSTVSSTSQARRVMVPPTRNAFPSLRPQETRDPAQSQFRCFQVAACVTADPGF